MRVVKPTALKHLRAKLANEDLVADFYDNFVKCLNKNDLINLPHMIYNTDEIGATIDHKPYY